MRKVAILMYHRVENLNDDYNMQAVTPSNFEEQIKYLCGHYDILRLEDDYESWFHGERDGVILTFDDGYYDYCANALPIMEKYHVPSTVFVSTGNIDSDKENWTDDILRYIFASEKQQDYLDIRLPFYTGRLYTGSYPEKFSTYYFIRRVLLNASRAERENYLRELAHCTGLGERGRANRRMMTSQELRQIARSGNVLIGAHTESHISLGRLGYAEQEEEIRNSKLTLEEITGRKITCFSYPFGGKEDYTEETMKILRENGIEKAVTTSAKCVGQEPLLELPRFWVKNYAQREFEAFMEKEVFRHSGESENAANANIVYIGGLGQDATLKKTKASLAIWGAGARGKGLLQELGRMGISGWVEAFGDNSSAICGEKVCGVTVCSLEEIKQLQRNKDCHILVTGQYDLAICKQLIQSGIKNIHLYI